MGIKLDWQLNNVTAKKKLSKGSLKTIRFSLLFVECDGERVWQRQIANPTIEKTVKKVKNLSEDWLFVKQNGRNKKGIKMIQKKLVESAKIEDNPKLLAKLERERLMKSRHATDIPKLCNPNTMLLIVAMLFEQTFLEKSV